MLILVRHAPPFRRWHRRLGERLAAAGHEVAFEPVGQPFGRRLLAIEHRLYGIVPDWDAQEPQPAEPFSQPELTIALVGAVPSRGLVVHPEPDEAGLLLAVRAGKAPRIVVSGGDPQAPRPLSIGRPAIEDPLVLARGLEDVWPRLVTLLVQAVARLVATDADAPPELDQTKVAPIPSGLAFLARRLSNKLARRFGAARGRPDHWRIVLRREGEGESRLAEDASGFRADPFLFEDAGRLWLFYEDYSYAAGKGVIGCLPVEDWACRSPRGEEMPRVVLEETFHLSYPLVLRHRNAIYMLPETSAAACVQLYRADPFPDRWVPEVVLVEGRRLADATPILHEGRWWLFATSTDDGGSSWDQLHLYHAPDLLGPWTPHAGNPVLIDAGAARPAGRMWQQDGVLMRPAQDCRTGYGDAVAICRVDRLDLCGYSQSVVRRLEPPPGATGLHTLDRAAGWEAVDLKVPHPP